jgi:cobalamin biosynthesis protein CobW
MNKVVKIPTTVVTGFLGAGKTTLISHMLKTANRRIALIINEFGDVGIDGDVLKSCTNGACGADDIVELSNGCICCTVADDFIPTMNALIDRTDPPEHIVIETSGLALPQPLIRAFNWPDIRTRVTIDGVITVADGHALSNGGMTSDPMALEAQRRADPSLDHDDPIEEVFEDQLVAADLVVVSKTDLISAEDLERVISDLASKTRNGTGIVSCSGGQADPAVLIGLNATVENDLSTRTGHHEEGEEHDHDDFETFVIEFSAFPSRNALENAVRNATKCPSLLRLKGFAALDDHDMRLVVQAVGPRVDSWFDRDFRSGEEHKTRLVAIGLKGLDRQNIISIMQQDLPGQCIY